MNFLAENWKWIGLVASVICFFAIFLWVAVQEFPANKTVMNWSTPEAIFYGFCVLAVATLLS